MKTYSTGIICTTSTSFLYLLYFRLTSVPFYSIQLPLLHLGATEPRHCPKGNLSPHADPMNASKSATNQCGGVSTPCVAVSFRGIAVLAPGMLELYMYGRLPDRELGLYPPLALLPPQSTAYQLSVDGAWVSTLRGAVSILGTAFVVPD